MPAHIYQQIYENVFTEVCIPLFAIVAILFILANLVNKIKEWLR